MLNNYTLDAELKFYSIESIFNYKKDMTMLNNVKLSTKIIAGFGVIIIFMILVGYVGYSGMRGITDRVVKADDVNRIVKLIQDIRQNEKNFIMRGDKKYAENVHTGIDAIIAQANETKMRFKQNANKEQMDAIISNIDSYSTAFNRYIASENNKNSFMEEMRAQAREAINELETIRADQKKQLNQLIVKQTDGAINNQSGIQQDINDKIKKADDANRAIKWFLELRKNEKEIIISGENKYYGAVAEGMKKINTLVTDLKSRFSNEENIQQADSAIAHLLDYHTKFNEFTKMIQQQKKDEQAMLEAARTVREVANAARADQKNKMENQINQSNFTILSFSTIALLLGVALSALIIINFKKSLTYALDIAALVANGDFSQEIKITSKDEMGVLLTALKKMVASLQKVFLEILTNVGTISSSATELSAISYQMAANSEQSAKNSNNVSSASEEMSSNMSSVASAAEQTAQNVSIVAASAEEMSTTIEEIAQNTEKGRVISLEAVNQTNSASQKMEMLGSAAKKVSKITEAITEISEQTNLLALNATIEAARAGEAGKGFAIVANEIKELAAQTAEATEKIRQQLEDIQNSTQSTITEIDQVTKTINEVNDVVSTIASAIEEQSIATKEIVGNVVQASQGIQEVTENVTQASVVSGSISQEIAQVNSGAQEINTASSQVQLSAEDLSKMSEQLKEMVNQFKLT